MEALKWQFNLVWQLAEYHLPALTDEMCLWEPSAHSWNVRIADDGQWRADFSESEPSPLPTATIGWLTWQMLWWWEAALCATEGTPMPKPEDIAWPGSALLVRERLAEKKARWETFLGSLDTAGFDRKIPHLWPEPRPVWQTIAWLNGELMKNVAEIGYVRMLYGAK